MSRSFILMALALLATGLAFAAPGTGDSKRGKTLADARCAACHGFDGNNPPAPNYPKLGGQQLAYILHEINEYREDRRPGEVMKPMVQDLSEADILDIATWYSIQAVTPAAVTRPELLALGKKIYFEGNSDTGVPSCDGCHEENGKGSARFPRIAGQNPEYVIEEFKRYANGQRKFGKKIMRTIAERMTERETQAVAEFMATLK